VIQQATSVNIAIRVIESICSKFDIEIPEKYKSILAILIPSLIYKDGCIVIMAESIHQINRIIKKHNEKIDFVSILLAWNCISSIDKYGAITIPLSFFLNKLNVNRIVINKQSNKYLSKKVLTNATQTLCTAEVLSHLGIPKIIAIPLVNLILEFFYMDLKKERQMMTDANVAFKGYKMSEVTRILKQMQFEKIFLSTAILMVITHIGLNISASLIFVSILTEMFEIFKAEYKMKTAKGFLK
jgi:hypothetical protein